MLLGVQEEGGASSSKKSDQTAFKCIGAKCLAQPHILTYINVCGR